MSAPAYQGMTQRNFRHALKRLLETDYGVLGSQRVLDLLAEDVQGLIEEFYPPPERLAPGWMVFVGTKASGSKARPGQHAGQRELVTLAWPVLLPDDIQELADKGDTQARREVWLQKRLIRLIEYGWHHSQGPVLLTQADLAILLGLTDVRVSKLLQAARKQTGKPLITVGYYFDQGRKPTHKAEIIDYYEAGMDEVKIARLSQHSQAGVGNYIRGYERVKRMIKHGTDQKEISFLIDMQPSTVEAYAKIVAKYHPELFPAQNPP